MDAAVYSAYAGQEEDYAQNEGLCRSRAAQKLQSL